MSIRITGGIFRGRLLNVPAKGVRPTQDKVRAAIFSSLQSVVPGAKVLDLFAGTGAFGLEALSRGAEFACFVEADHKTLSCLKENAERLAGNEEQKWQIVRSDVEDFLAANRAQTHYDVIFADPPYDSAGEWTKKILFHLEKKPILREKGFFVIESGAKSPAIETEAWRIRWQRVYGETRVCMYMS